MEFLIRTIVATVALLAAAFMCATVFWVACHISRAKREDDELERLVDDAVDEGIRHFERLEERIS